MMHDGLYETVNGFIVTSMTRRTRRTRKTRRTRRKRRESLLEFVPCHFTIIVRI